MMERDVYSVLSMDLLIFASSRFRRDVALNNWKDTLERDSIRE